MHGWVKRPLDEGHDGRLLGLSCRESAVREGAPGTANLAGAGGFAPKNPAKICLPRNGFFPVNWQSQALGCAVTFG